MSNFSGVRHKHMDRMNHKRNTLQAGSSERKGIQEQPYKLSKSSLPGVHDASKDKSSRNLNHSATE
jgi:hypothetical protein